MAAVTLLPIISVPILLAKMLEYNHYLLNEKSKESTPVVDKKALLEMLKGLSEEERNGVDG